MEEISYRVQNEATKIFTSLDKEIIRKMMGDMYRCSAKCCDNATASTEDVQRCVETCSAPLTNAQNYVEQEIQNFQSRLNRCAMDCQDRIRDKMSSNLSQTDQLQLKQEMETCVGKCADEHIKKLPDLSKRLKSTIKNM